MLIIGDLHFKASTRADDQKLCHTLLSIVQPEESVILLGDMEDGKAHIHSHAHATLIDFLSNLRSMNCRVYAILGNHDLDSENRSLLKGQYDAHPLLGINLCIVVDRPIRDDVDCMECVFCPYVPKGELAATLNGMSGKYLFCHQEFRGCDYGIVSQHGDDQMPQFKTVYAGHIHTQQTVGNVVYVGTPRTTNFGDTSEKRVVRLENGIQTDIIVDHPRHKTFETTLQEIADMDDGKFLLLLANLSNGKSRITLLCDSAADWRHAKVTKRIRELAEVSKVIPQIAAIKDVVTQRPTGFWQSFNRIADSRALAAMQSLGDFHAAHNSK